MRVELTYAQLNKLTRLSPESWKALLGFVKEGGSGDFTPDLVPLKELGLVQKVGPHAYIKFPIDGSLPQQLPTVAKRSRTNEFPAFLTVWRKHSREYMTGADVAALKRFVNNFSLEEFETMLKRFADKFEDPMSVRFMWSVRNKLQGKTLMQVFGDDDE